MKVLIKNSFVLVFILTCFCLNPNAQVKTSDDYINAAMANSPTLKDYYSQLGQNRIDSMIEGSVFKPQVAMSGVAMYAPTYGQFGYDEAISNGGEYAAIVSVTQQIAPRKQVTLTRMLFSFRKSNDKYRSQDRRE